MILSTCRPNILRTQYSFNYRKFVSGKHVDSVVVRLSLFVDGDCPCLTSRHTMARMGEAQSKPGEFSLEKESKIEKKRKKH